MTRQTDQAVLVHLGFPKALSSWLQQLWFIPEHGYQTVLDPVQVQLKLIDPSPFNFNTEAACTYLEQQLQADTVPVITSEALAGNMYSGGYDGKSNVDRVLALAPNARLLLIVREQRGLIRSMYKSMITWGLPHSIERLLQPVEPRLAPQFNLDFLCFDQRVAYYQQQVGPERLLVLPYEAFAINPRNFLQQIHQFAGVGELPDSITIPSQRRVNTGQTLANLYLQRWYNICFVSSPFNYAGLFRADEAPWQRRVVRSKRNPLPAFMDNWFEARFRDTVRAGTEGKFGASNQRLQELTGLDLAGYGYDLGL